MVVWTPDPMRPGVIRLIRSLEDIAKRGVHTRGWGRPEVAA